MKLKMKKNKYLPEDVYREVLKNLVVPCVDIVLRNPHGEFLLIKRDREPLRGKLWIIGGRMLKGETILNSAKRKLREEVGIRNAKGFIPLGYYEEFFETNPFGDPEGVHTISFVFTAMTSEAESVKLDYQSSEYKWSKRLPKHFMDSFQDISTRQWIKEL